MFNDGPHKKDQMHPEDIRNLVIFFVIAILLYFTYDHFVQKPNEEAMRQQRTAEVTRQALEKEKPPVVYMDRDEVLYKSKRVDIDNGKVRGTISLQGGRIDDLFLEEYFETLDKVENVAVLSPKDTKLSRYLEYGWVSSDENMPMPGPDTIWRVQGNTKLSTGKPLILAWDNGRGLRFIRQIAIDENYMFTITQSVVNNTGRPVTLYPYGLVAQKGIPEGYQKIWIMHEGPTGWIGKDLIELNYKDLREETKQSFKASKGWTGITEKYWLTALVPPQKQNVKYSYNYKGELKDEQNTGLYQADFVADPVTVRPGRSTEVVSRAFVGPKRVLLLNKYKDELDIPNFDLAVDFGWLWFLSKPFFYALHYLHQFLGNMGVAIIVLTIMIRSAVFPLTNTSYRSFAKMKKVSPQVMELRKKYGEDKAALQKELIKMYEREGVNPMAGCIPIVLQIPIFFALYKTLRVTIEMRHAPFFGWIKDLSAPDPTSVFNLFGLIPWDPPAALHIGVFPCVMLIVMIMQRNLNPPPQDPLQRDMMRFFPFIITYVLSRFASGLVIYWTFSALIGLIQQIIIMRSLNVPIHLFGQTEEEKEMDEAVRTGPALHPLAEMAEEDMEEALFGEHEEDGEKPKKPKKKVSPPKRKTQGKKKKKK